MAKGSLRDLMPVTAKLIDEFREVFGAKSIDQSLRRAMNGEPTFYAEENGHKFGTPSPVRPRVQWDERGRPYWLNVPAGEVQEEATTKFAARERREQLKGMK